ncbi:tail fiber domain-containing protein [Hanstruepera ponticola]|uniref:tail fiber domain-containing protein n=1 Tax=Hanstruepera ponticola TaxID=2042995 RepID=UPI000CF0A486|nr:tail fiber domain-containing protein [Hanstruepera ponticola]
MKARYIVALFSLIFQITIAQVGIGTTSPSASLDIKSSSQTTPSNTDGLLIPKIDEFPSSNPGVNQDGMLVYATGNGAPAKGFYYWDNATTSWVFLIEKNYGDTNYLGANPTGLEALDEGNGIGWRLIDKNPANYGNIGLNAVDHSHSNSASGTRGATGENSTAIGLNTEASGINAFAIGNGTIASGDYSIALGAGTNASVIHSTAMGLSTTASGITSTALGRSTIASGENSTAMGLNTEASGVNSVAMGNQTEATASFSTAIGYNNVGGGNTTAWVSTDPLFEIGNGVFGSSNALTVLKNGTITAPSFDISEITNNKALITKEYADANYIDATFSGDYNDLTNQPTITNPTGLERIVDDGGGTAGFRLIGRDLTRHGSLGFEAVDLSISSEVVTQATGNPYRVGNGPMGNYAFTSGFNSSAKGYLASAHGYGTRSESVGAFSIGLFNVGAPGNPTVHVGTDPIFEVGNGLSNTSRSNALTILKNGNVGIGTTTPSYPLHVTSFINGLNSAPAYYLNASVGYGANGSGWTYSIAASRAMFSSLGFATGSDERIKNIVGISDSKEDLKSLMNIEITDYSFKDYKMKGDMVSKKVIAQQVKEVLPNAVNLSTEFIPNVYQLAAVKQLNNGNMSLQFSKSISLSKGDTIKLVTKDNIEVLAEVLKVSEKSLVIKKTINDFGNQIFVFGSQVEDFHSVDYDAISMLNVSATQEQQKRIEQQQKEIEALKLKLQNFETLSSRIEKIEAQLAPTNQKL